MRVAYLPDSFHEVNGVAHTSRNFQAYAQRHGLPFLCVRAALPGVRGHATLATEGTVTTLTLPRSRAAFALEKDLSFDPLFARHYDAISRALHTFQPDVVHITGPSELGIFGAYFAWKHGIPLVASWHTNLHEYAGRRLGAIGRRLPALARAAEAATLTATTRFYRMACVLYAPNEELCAMLERRTGRPCRVMRRGVDTQLFTPARRTRSSAACVLGYVGRLSIEKNVALLPQVQAAVHNATNDAGTTARFCIVGHGAEEATLRAAMPTAQFPGVLRGEALATAYADMDLFVFPSETDTFGNVVLEALASGVPAAVTTGGGPKFIVQHGTTGIVHQADDLPAAIARLLQDPAQLQAMRTSARNYALTCSWDAIFDDVYAGYTQSLSL